MASGRIPGPIGRQTPQIDPGTLARTDSPTRGPIGAGQAGKNADLAKQKRELALDIAQLTLDIAGIFDPTPITDGANTLLALARGNWFDALTSAVSMVPYIGDLAKTAKLPKYIASVRKAIGVARLDPKWAANLRELFVKLKTYVDKCLDVGADALPDVAKRQLRQLQAEIDRFLNPRVGMAPKGPSAAGGGGAAKSSPPSSNQANAGPSGAPEPLDNKGAKGHSSGKNDVVPKTATDPKPKPEPKPAVKPEAKPKQDGPAPKPEQKAVVPKKKKTPHGFDSPEDFKLFSKTANKELGKAGYKDAIPSLQGSAVTGKSYSTGKPFGTHSDFDMAISSETLFKKAQKKGLEIGKNPSRVGPLTEKEIKSLGLGKLQKKLINQSGGREVNFMLFKNQDKVLRWSTDTIPLK